MAEVDVNELRKKLQVEEFRAKLASEETQVAPTQEARKPRFDFEGVGKSFVEGDPVGFAGKTGMLGLQGLGSVADLVKAGTDKVVAGVPLGESLDRYYKNDPTYTPGDATVEKFIPNNVAGQTVAKTALDIGSDPTTWAAPFAKAAPRLAKLVQQAESQSPGTALKVIGKVGEFFTGGRMGTKWAQSTAKFTPMERIRSGKTLDEAADAYHPLKKAADEFMSGRLTSTAKETFKPVQRFYELVEPGLKAPGSTVIGPENPRFQNLDEASQYLDDAINKLRRMRNGAEPPGELLAIQKGIKDIKARGVTAGPETAELMDFLNNIEFTGFGNPRLVKDILKGPQAQGRAALKELTTESSPVYGAARQRVSDSINMAAPPSGGKMGKYMIQNAPTMAATAGAAGEMAGGRWGDAAKVAGSILGLRNPKAYNVAAGVGGGINQGLKSAVGAIGQGLSSEIGKQAIVQGTKADFNKTAEFLKAPELSKTLQSNPQAFGKFAVPLMKSAQRGPTALSATSYVLWQIKPEYREIQRQINGQEQPNQ